jgi:hypothetical protein
MMKQFEVFDNPVVAARRAFPFVAILQSDQANIGRNRIVAPLVPRARMPGTAGRLAPHVSVSGAEHVLLIPGMTALRAADLQSSRGDLSAHRPEITAALEYLFLGV